MKICGVLVILHISVGVVCSREPAVHQEHPRIFLTADQIREVSERCEPGGPVAREYEALRAWVDGFIRDGRAMNGSGLPGLCVVYQVEKSAGRDADQYVDYLVNGLWGLDGKGGGSSLSSGRQWFPDGVGTVLEGYMGGRGTWYAWDAMAYDWFYDALTTAQRKLYGDMLGSWMHSFMGIDPDQPAEITLRWGSYLYNQTWGPSGGYAWGNYYTRDGVGTKTMVALAISGEGTDYEASARQWLISFSDRLPTEFIPAIERMGGAWAAGPNHGGAASQSVVLSLAAWRSATGENLFNRFQSAGLRELAWWAIFGTMPHNLWWGHINDNGAGMRQRVQEYAVRCAPLLARLYRQPAAQWLGLHFAPSAEDRSWPFVLWHDPTVRQPPPSELPLSHHFAGTGQVYMRNDWESPDATWAYFECGPQFIGYQSEGNGSFQIYKGGGLAMRGGTDRRSGTRSPSMNTVLVYNSNEQGDERNDGGTLPGVSSEQRTPAPRGVMTAYGSGEEYTYACGDLSGAYSSTTVQSYTRQFLYLRAEPECFVVYDRVVAANADNPKMWLLHTMNEPVVSTAGAPAQLTSSGPGYFSFLGADRALSSTYTPESNPRMNGGAGFLASGFGAMVCQTLLPERVLMTKRGGPGYDNWGCPYDPEDNRNFGPANSGGEGGELMDRSWWRLEVEPVVRTEATEFLHVISPVLIPEASPLSAHQLSVSDFPAAAVVDMSDEVVSLRVSLGNRTWAISLRRQGQPGGSVELLEEDQIRSRWDLPTEVRPSPSFPRSPGGSPPQGYLDRDGNRILGLFGTDATVGFDDFLLFAEKFGTASGDPGFRVEFDIEPNGRIDFSDFLVFAGFYGKTAVNFPA